MTGDMGRHAFRRAAFLLLWAVVPAMLSGCMSYAKWSGRGSYVAPDKAAAALPADGKGPLVLCVTGSMIVREFYDIMEKRLLEAGFRPVVFQPPDLFTEPLAAGALRISEAVDKVLAVTGEKKLILLAECNGGVASRYYIEKLGGAAKVSRFITYVSAHHGTASTSWFNPYPAISDIRPESPYMAEMRESRPPADGPLTISIFICTDEIMKPYATSRLPGALNIEICDKDFDRRARKRTPPNVGNFVGNILLAYCPVHLAVFWDEEFFGLLKSCLRDSPEEIRAYKGLSLKFE